MIYQLRKLYVIDRLYQMQGRILNVEVSKSASGFFEVLAQHAPGETQDRLASLRGEN
jgi:hypothetical protein